ncbi:hypothetical protein Tco_1068311 [Tanacetum coccineum]|uniref:Uncharacterized protein n=1 Tax=Tanacetum coccineum TaxID=301880 RepID=A0ABQ5HGS3_9ASTR
MALLEPMVECVLVKAWGKGRGFSTWMAFGGNTRDLSSFEEETDKITYLHQILEDVLFTERGDGVTGIKRRRRDPSSDDVKDLSTASRRSQLNEDLESSTLLDAVWITVAHVFVNAAQLELILLVKIYSEVNAANENMLGVSTASEYQVNTAS